MDNVSKMLSERVMMFLGSPCKPIDQEIAVYIKAKIDEFLIDYQRGYEQWLIETVESLSEDKDGTLNFKDNVEIISPGHIRTWR